MPWFSPNSFVKKSRLPLARVQWERGLGGEGLHFIPDQLVHHVAQSVAIIQDQIILV